MLFDGSALSRAPRLSLFVLPRVLLQPAAPGALGPAGAVRQNDHTNRRWVCVAFTDTGQCCGAVHAHLARRLPVAYGGAGDVTCMQRPVWSESGTTLVIWSLKKRNRLIGPDPWIRLNSYRSLPDQIQIRSIPDSYRSITDQITQLSKGLRLGRDHLDLAPARPCVCAWVYLY